MRQINFNKKSFSVLIIVFAMVTGIAIQSCKNDDSFNQDNFNQKALDFEFDKTSQQDVQKTNSWFNENYKKNNSGIAAKSVKSSKMNLIEYDFENSISLSTGEDSKMIIVNQKGLSKNNKANYALSFIKNSTETKSYLIAKAINVSKNIRKIEYYNFYNTLVLTTIFNNNDKTITNIKFSKKGSSKTVFNFSTKPSFTLMDLMKIQTANAECYNGSYSQYIIDCMEDVYTQHGWISIWAAVQTYVIPQTGLALTAACAVNGLIEQDCFDGF